MASIPRKTDASLPSSAEPSSAARRWKYYVYLSFRGDDTRRGFTFQLYDGLQRRGVKTFMNHHDLQVGDDVSATLLKAIEGSRFTIVVLSQNYAYSTWCLEELTKIWQFMEDGPRILPVFYDVEPSDVRNQRGDFEDAFAKHVASGRFEPENVQQWRDALRRTADISGFVSQNFSTESKCVEDIVEDVYRKLQPFVEINTADFDDFEPSSAAGWWKYDVYLSFWGLDTRRVFTSHLYDRLQKRGITTFIDDQDRGEVISSSLLEAIEGSRILPVFYYVEPSDVRNQRGSFQKAFSRHEERFEPEKVLQWRDALRRIGNLFGWVAQDYKSQMDLFEAIVESVCSKLQPVVVSQSPDLTKIQGTNWKKGDLLGSGSFGSVYEGITDGGSFFAVKQVSLLDQGKVSRLEQEIALLSQFQHKNIVQYYGTQKDESKLYIFLELVTKGSLQKLYQSYPLTDSHVSVYTRQILQGLKYLHDQNVIHRDIKCANILVHVNGSIKLADFGLAKAIKVNDIISCQGTPNWMAPELAKPGNPGYGLPADIWSLGCTVLEMLTGMVPYSNLEWMAVLWKIMKGEPPLVPDSLSREAQDFIHLCLQVEPDNRPTAAQLLEHPFVNKPLPPTSSGSVSPYNHHRQS
ncbi:hypothetical protein ABKV19_002727 [Rosa sericea]